MSWETISLGGKPYHLNTLPAVFGKDGDKNAAKHEHRAHSRDIYIHILILNNRRTDRRTG